MTTHEFRPDLRGDAQPPVAARRRRRAIVGVAVAGLLAATIAVTGPADSSGDDSSAMSLGSTWS